MNILRLAPLLLLAGLAGCSIFSGPKTEQAAPGTPLRACQDAAEADTSLNKYAAANASPIPTSGNTYEALLTGLRRQSVDDCLQRHGALPRGGVERVKGG